MADSSWRDDLSRITSRAEDLTGFLDLTEAERGFLGAPRTHGRLPLRLSPQLVRRLAAVAHDAGGRLPVAHPLRREFIPTAAELVTISGELADPLGEKRRSPLPRLIHSYPDRALLLVTDQCAVHCRHCFRSRFTGGDRGAVSARELAEVSTYLAGHPEIRELILSGGDALMLADEPLGAILDAARQARPEIVFRVATRLPIMLPGRVTSELLKLLRAYAPLWVVVQVNHSAELDGEAAQVLGRLVESGLPVINQTVLLSGVNDDVATLEELFTTLVRLQVKPYYLFQGDLAPGTAHFRVNLERALEIVAELRRRISGLAMPVFAVDIPGGAGKVRLEPSALVGEDEAGYRLRAQDGEIYHYPKE
jgi:lysine 2,3-aminomutase